MTEDTITIGGDSADIPPATYPAKLFALSKKQSTAYGDFRAWDFLLDQKAADGGDLIVGGASSMNTGKKSKGGRWIAALLGQAPEKGTTLSASSLLGRPCLVVVEENDEGWPTVTNVLPPMAAASPVAAAVPAGAVSPSAPAAAPAVTISDDLPF